MTGTPRITTAAGLAATLLLATGPVSGQVASPYPEFPGLQQGRSVWMGTCRECHANPMSDAPQVKNGAAWDKRLAKGKAALYASATKGLVTANSEMPPRGGNSSLSDADVRTAVDYMITLVNAARNSKGNPK